MNALIQIPGQINLLLAPLLKPLDKFLNNITMYRSVLSALSVISFAAIVLSFLGILTYQPVDLIVSIIVLHLSGLAANFLLAKLFKAHTNVESVFITILILFLILAPGSDIQSIILLSAASVAAMASKYFLAWKGRHMFNPAAFGAFTFGLIGGGAVWWVGTPVLLPLVLITGFGILRKLQRFELVAVFILTSFIPAVLFGLRDGATPLESITQSLLNWPSFFLAIYMLTEPFTLPPLRWQRNVYAMFVGLLSTTITVNVGPIYLTPELGLLIGNFGSWLVGPRQLIKMKLQAKRQIAADTFEFIFDLVRPLQFLAGQYVEVTLPHKSKDARGNRRYFTIAASPTENTLNLGIKFNKPSSTFKEALAQMEVGSIITAGQLGGDFILPDNKNAELIFMAGGIGVTPFRSMIKYLLDTKDQRKVTLFYAVNTLDAIAYKNFFDKAQQNMNLKVVYIVAAKESVGTDWVGETGFLTPEILNKHLANLEDHRKLYYISGPNMMVEIYKNMLYAKDVTAKQIRTDYFPGFA